MITIRLILLTETVSGLMISPGDGGLSSYPHPCLILEFWQSPTGSMGIGPISTIYQARFMRYMVNHRLGETAERRVCGTIGDGEMDQSESTAL
jgi:pyruvate dehydrogenase E1 component